MASTKDIYEAKIFAAGIFAAGVFRGTGVTAAGPDMPGIEYRATDDRTHYTLTDDRMHYEAGEP